MRITRLWHRCEVSRFCWEGGLNRLARHRGATNMQFVKRKENALSVNSSSLGKNKPHICENDVCLYCLAGVSKSLMKTPRIHTHTHTHVPGAVSESRPLGPGWESGLCGDLAGATEELSLWGTHLRPGQTRQSTDTPAITAALELTLRVRVLLRDLGYYQYYQYFN